VKSCEVFWPRKKNFCTCSCACAKKSLSLRTALRLWGAAIFLTGLLIGTIADRHLHVQYAGRKNLVGNKQMTEAKKKKTNAFITFF
jgi:hypothetical protein